ncbi:MAG: PEP-CTERM sorting domain-containing protein [Pirellulales bacterium]|nr:PEP-CTERM sorting domain-containing protein [Pirellulales bacterium]
MKFFFALVLVLTGLACTPASAVLVAYEGFDYAEGTDQDVSTLNGGTDWAGPWGTHSGSVTTMDIGTGSLAIGNLLTTGNSRGGDASDSRNGRTFTNAIDGTQDAWISFVAQDTNQLGTAASFTLFSGGSGGVGGTERMTIQETNGNWFTTIKNPIPPGNLFQTDTIGDGIDSDTRTFFLLHFDYASGDGDDTTVTIDLYTGGDLNGTPTMGESFVVPDFALSFDTIRITRDLAIDEIRIGTDRADVVPLASVPGDFNLNNVVDSADYVVWRKHLGGSDGPLNGNGDNSGNSSGVVDQADYDLWRAQFGNPVSIGASLASGTQTVPEPASLFLLIAGGIGSLSMILRHIR